MKMLVLSVIICWGVFGCMSLEERLSSRNQNVRTAAEYELVAKSRRSGSVAERVAALKKVKCEPLLARVALDANKENGSDVDGKIAVSRISDQELLFKIAMEGNAENVCADAASKYVRSADMYLPKVIELYDRTQFRMVKVVVGEQIAIYWISRCSEAVKKDGYYTDDVRNKLWNVLDDLDIGSKRRIFDRVLADKYALRLVGDLYESYRDYMTQQQCESVFKITKRNDVNEWVQILNKHNERISADAQYAKEAVFVQQCITAIDYQNRDEIIKRMLSVKDSNLIFLFLSSDRPLHYHYEAGDAYKRGLKVLLGRVNDPAMIPQLRKRGVFCRGDHNAKALLDSIEQEWLLKQF